MEELEFLVKDNVRLRRYNNILQTLEDVQYNHEFMNWKECGFLCVNRSRLSGTDDKRKQLSGETDYRIAAESDFGRVIFSSACRRLHDKTQVFPLTTNDNIHSRLTHSLEVMNMGLSFCIDLSENIDFLKGTGLEPNDVLRTISAILKTSCIVHDIGNPPFGHFGEAVIQDYFTKLFDDLHDRNHYIWQGIEKMDYLTKTERKGWDKETCDNARNGRMNYIKSNLELFLGVDNEDWRRDYTEFDGNAEGLRILSRLQNAGDLYGLNLTYGTLAASIKYPNTGRGDKNDGNIGKHKHGVMFTEKNLLHAIVKECNIHNNGDVFRHPLAFLMEAADSICYLTMDIDDAVGKKWVKFEDVMNLIENCDDPDKSKILSLYDAIILGNYNPRKSWICLRTAMLGYLMEVATKNFVSHLQEIEVGSYNNELIEDGCMLTKKLQDFSRKNILSHRDINLLETTGKSVISGLIDQYIRLMFHPDRNFRDKAKVLLSRSILVTVIMEHIRDHETEYNYKYKMASCEDVFDRFDIGDLTAEERFRIIRDYIAGMTDKFALNHYQELSGQKLS